MKDLLFIAALGLAGGSIAANGEYMGRFLAGLAGFFMAAAVWGPA